MTNHQLSPCFEDLSVCRWLWPRKPLRWLFNSFENRAVSCSQLPLISVSIDSRFAGIASTWCWIYINTNEIWISNNTQNFVNIAYPHWNLWIVSIKSRLSLRKRVYSHWSQRQLGIGNWSIVKVCQLGSLTQFNLGSLRQVSSRQGPSVLHRPTVKTIAQATNQGMMLLIFSFCCSFVGRRKLQCFHLAISKSCIKRNVIIP